ncbi:MAG: hypothetical protein ETSY1_08940 [Candidatus Entotheonella factor]|uniref:Uncharacterized protein n=1 Tax=Entotheonella factor TaxID=1429438 RepID=W4LSV1_ENTF1|nr:MAG: hypothetical protein ETSY1_08940 [Candidatus Entotheonella factor]
MISLSLKQASVPGLYLNLMRFRVKVLKIGLQPSGHRCAARRILLLRGTMFIDVLVYIP